MPFMQRITWSGVALHEGVLPGYPASHGCIRLKGDFAVFMWGTTKIGSRVIVTEGEPAPVSIASPKLFTPLARAARFRHRRRGRQRQGHDHRREERGARRRRADSSGDAKRRAGYGGADAIREAQDRRLSQRAGLGVREPQDQQAYVRYDYEPLFEAPVTIKNPDRPLGTHVYTAMEATDSGMRWSAISIPTPVERRAGGDQARQSEASGKPRR